MWKIFWIVLLLVCFPYVLVYLLVFAIIWSISNFIFGRRTKFVVLPPGFRDKDLFQ